MAVLHKRLLALLEDPRTRKVLSAAGSDGVPHTVFKDSIRADSEGNIRFYELIETSSTNKNLVYSLWFKKPVSIAVLGVDDTSFDITGIPYRSIICGGEFEEAYISIRKSLGGDADLSAIWVIKPESVRENTFQVRLREAAGKYPLIGHLDRYLNEQA
ncbi:MAG: hypothetical protein LBC62_05455 [Treponema sp.]|jgi:hypothetical protein|nr:hypothetical protein [Treponema sp.]